MENYAEKRRYERHSKKLPVSVSTDESPYQYYYGNMYNYSRGGMYLRCSEKINVGQQVYVKIKKYDESADGPQKYKECYGYVRWSSELGTSSPGGQYGYGVEYMVPVDY